MPFERDAFRFNSFGTSEKRLSSRLEIRVLALCVNHSLFMLGNDTNSIFRKSTYNFPALL